MIQIRRLNFSVGSFALRDISLHVRPEEYFVLLGPTGSGKTLLIECLCGLNRIDSGRIQIAGTEVTHLEPRRRGVGYLPQDYALFPHKTVRGNICFGLNHRRSSREEVRQQVDRLMDQLGVAHLADRLPSKLSGGEQQRVALARALAIRPRVLLLDEPVSAVDEQTRDVLCRQLKQVQKRTETTAVHICHSFAEMLAVADRVGIIRRGRIVQVGTPQEVLQRPADAQVARFVQAGNLFPARAEPFGEWIDLTCAGGIRFRARKPNPASSGGDVVVMVRPENIHLGVARPENVLSEASLLEGSIRDLIDLGPTVRVNVACGPEVELLVSLGKKEYYDRGVGVGDRVFLSVVPEDVHVMQR